MEKTVTAVERQTLGEDKVRVSLTLPALAENDASPLKKGFSRYYGGMRTGFLRFARVSLLKRAEGSATPFGAVLKAVVSYENESVVSVYVDAAVSTDAGRSVTRLPQIWDKKSGTLIRGDKVFVRRAKRALLPLAESSALARAESAAVPLYSDWKELLKRRFDLNAFYLSPRGLVFVYGAGVLSEKNEIFPVHISKDELTGLVVPQAFSAFWSGE